MGDDDARQWCQRDACGGERDKSQSIGFVVLRRERHNVTNATSRGNEGGISGAQTRGHVAELGGERRSTRLKITNSKLAEYVWSRK